MRASALGSVLMGKTIVVTGGSSGIGLATVRRLAAAGHQVFSLSRRPDRTPLPDGATPVVCDLARADCADALRTVLDASGRIDALVNNAGAGELLAIEETPEDAARHIMEVNVFGALRLARAAVSIMREQGQGRIVNVTSLNDAMSSPFGGWYSASKAALAAASYSLAMEVRQFGIHVTVVSPGFFRTEMAESTANFAIDPDSRYRNAAEALKAMQAQRLATAGDPDEVAATIESVIADATPPIRVVVGEDAKAMVATGLDPNAYVPATAQFVQAVNTPS